MSGFNSLHKSLSNEQIHELKEAFNLFDIDGSGEIDPHEVLASLDSLGFNDSSQEIKKIIHELSQIKSHSISFDDFISIFTRVMQSRDPIEEMEKVFMHFDDDDTGKISFRNLKRVSIELGEQLTDSELQLILKEADKDGDGEISKEEFIRILKEADIE